MCRAYGEKIHEKSNFRSLIALESKHCESRKIRAAEREEDIWSLKYIFIANVCEIRQVQHQSELGFLHGVQFVQRGRNIWDSN